MKSRINLSNVLESDIDLLLNSFNSFNSKYPIMDQRYNDKCQQIIIAVPGATIDDLKVEVKRDILNIQRVNSAGVSEEYLYVKNNISRKKFDVSFRIPKDSGWDTEKTQVTLVAGELIITIPIKAIEEKIEKSVNIKINAK